MNEPLSKKQFDDALNLYQLEQFNEAREAFLDLVKVYPQHSEIWLNLGNAEFQLNALPNAEKSWKQCLEINPTENNVYLNLGNLYFKQNRYKKALNYWQQFIQLKPKQASVHLNMGLAFEQLGDLDQAFKFYKSYIQLNPSSTPARQLKKRISSAQTASLRNINTAEQALAKGQLKAAYAAFQKGFSQYSGTAKSYKAFATLLYKQDNLKDSLYYYLKAYDSDREDAGILVNIGVIYEKQKNYAQAIWAYHLAIDLNSADRDKVQSRLNRLIDKELDSLSKLLEKTQKELKQGNHTEASLLLNQLQELMVYQPELNTVVQELADALNMATSPKRRASKVYYAEGEKARAEGHYDQALSFYNKYIDAYPNGPHAGEVMQKRSEVQSQIGQVISTMMTMDKSLEDLKKESIKDE